MQGIIYNKVVLPMSLQSRTKSLNVHSEQKYSYLSVLSYYQYELWRTKDNSILNKAKKLSGEPVKIPDTSETTLYKLRKEIFYKFLTHGWSYTRRTLIDS